MATTTTATTTTTSAPSLVVVPVSEAECDAAWKETWCAWEKKETARILRETRRELAEVSRQLKELQAFVEQMDAGPGRRDSKVPEVKGLFGVAAAERGALSETWVEGWNWSRPSTGC